MKLHIHSLLPATVLALAASGVISAAETVTNVGSIDQIDQFYSKIYLPAKDSHTTVKYDSIKSAGVQIRTQLRGDSSLSIEIGSIDAGDKNVYIEPDAGDITLGDVHCSVIHASTKKGNITLTGNIYASAPDGSVITVAADASTPSGSIIIDGATLTNVTLQNYGWNESYNIIPIGAIEISGDTTLSGVCMQAGSVEVTDGANLTLEDVAFSARNAANQGEPAESSLVLGDNVTLTLSGDTPLAVKELTIGEGVNIIINLSEEAFADLGGSTFDVFSVTEGDVDLSSVNFTFTDGEQSVNATVSANGGSITVTNSNSTVPEPATATLSLLALAALAARRRRK